MKKLDTSPITNSSRFPFKKGTLQFMQDAHKETLASLIKALIGSAYDPATIYVMSGGLNSTTAPVYTISSGVIFYNGEVYEMDAASFTAGGANVAIFETVLTNYTTDADPVTFTDLTVRNVHNVYKMQIVQGAAGAGLADYSQAHFLSFRIPEQLNLSAPVIAPYADNTLQIIGGYPDHILYVPPPTANLFPIIATGTVAIGDVSAGGNTYTVTFAAPLASASFGVLGSFISNGAGGTDSTVMWSWKNPTTAGFTLHCNESGAFAQNLTFRYFIIQL